MTSNLWPVSIAFSFGGVVGCYTTITTEAPSSEELRPSWLRDENAVAMLGSEVRGWNDPTELERSRRRLVGLGDEILAVASYYRDYFI